ncbi:MAG: SDR family oxidoreductase [Bacteroidota bacterium]
MTTEKIFQNHSLKGKIALITGGSRSLGKETAKRLAERGADIVFTYKSNEKAARETEAALKEMGARVAVLQVDLTGSAQIGSFVEAFRDILQKWGNGKFDILVNNAGIISLKPFGQLTDEDLDLQYQTNYKSVVLLTQALADDLNNGGRIINLGSGTTQHVVPPLFAYAPMKSAIEGVTKYLAKMLGGRGITVNVVSPGGLDTDFNQEIFSNPQVVEYVKSQTALGRVGMAEDVGGVIAFLCSEDGRWMTGERIGVSGGMSL